MIFESQLKRQVRVQYLLLIFVDVVIAYLVTIVFLEGFLGGALVFVGLQVLSVVYLLFRSIIGWFFFKIARRKQIVSSYLDVFRYCSFPKPASFETSTDGYLRDIVDGDNYPMEMRLKAAELIGVIGTLERYSGLQGRIQLNIAMEEAISTYRDSL